MKTLKRTLCLVLALVMVLGFCAFGASAEFVDQEDVKYEKAVAIMTGIGAIKGDAEANTFRPQDTLTRAEAATILTRLVAMESVATGKSTFTDVPEWAEKYFAAMQAKKLIIGNGDGTVGAADKLTGSQWALMLLRAVGFTDEDLGIDGAGWEIAVAKAVKEHKLAAGITGFDATAPISREEACAMAVNCYGLSAEGKTTYKLMGKEFDDLLEATLYASILDGVEATDIETVQPKGSLELFSTLDKDETTKDDFKRDMTTWKFTAEGAKKATVVYKDVAAAKYTLTKTATNMADFDFAEAEGETLADVDFTALNKTLKLTEKSDKLASFATTAKVYINGAEASVNQIVAGDEVEIFVNKSKITEITKIVVVHYDLAQVSRITALKDSEVKAMVEADEDLAGVSKKVALKVGSNTKNVLDVQFAGFDYAAKDYVLVALKPVVPSAAETYDVVLASKSAELVEGKVDAIKSNKARIDGTYYGAATGVDLPTIGTEGVWALNAAGAIGAVVESKASSDYIYIYRVVRTAGKGSVNEDGLAVSAADAAYTVYGVLTDGTKASYKLAKNQISGLSNITWNVADESKDGVGTVDAVKAYKVNADDELSFVTGAETIDFVTAEGAPNTGKGELYGVAKIVTDTNSKTLYLTSETETFFVSITNSGTTNKVTVSTTTGYKDLKVAKDKIVHVIYNNTTGAVKCLFVGDKNGTAVETKRAIMLDSSYVKTENDSGADVFTYSVYDLATKEVVDLVSSAVLKNSSDENATVNNGDYFEYTMSGKKVVVDTTKTTAKANYKNVAFANDEIVVLADDTTEYALSSITDIFEISYSTTTRKYSVDAESDVVIKTAKNEEGDTKVLLVRTNTSTPAKYIAVVYVTVASDYAE